MDGNLSARKVRFGAFEVDRKAGELRSQGQVVPLQELPFRVLSLMLERAGDVVTRDELRRRIWAGQEFADSQHGVNKAINKIRRALRDNPQQPLFVETVGRRGYRFIFPLETLPDGRIKVRLAVLPFHALSDDPGRQYFCEGLTEELITQAGCLDPQRLGVIARTSVLACHNAGKDIAQIGRELDVEFVLEGTVRSAGDRVRITVQLIQVSDQTHLWTGIFEHAKGDDLTVQHNVASQACRELVRGLLHADEAQKENAGSQAGAVAGQALDVQGASKDTDPNPTFEAIEAELAVGLELEPDFS